MLVSHDDGGFAASLPFPRDQDERRIQNVKKQPQELPLLSSQVLTTKFMQCVDLHDASFSVFRNAVVVVGLCVLHIK